MKKAITKAQIKERKLLNKESTWHLVLELEKEVFPWQPGDSVAIFPQNEKEHVDRLLQSVPYDKNQEIVYRGAQTTLYDLLVKKASLSSLSLQEGNFYEKLPPLTPRLYSIASSSLKSTKELDLIVSRVSYEKEGKQHFGLCSDFLCRHSKIQESEIDLFFHASRHFAFSQTNAPILMIATGAGLAPFKAFLEEQYIHKKPLDNSWLIFGEKEKEHDFFFEAFLSTLQHKGLHLNTAFSRDQEDKFYVSDALLQKSKKTFEWIERGAIIYVCGSIRMGQSVEKALEEIGMKEGGYSLEDAKRWISKLKSQKRYLREVY